MKKASRIIFWIIFPILTVICSILLVFYLDLANGPFICLILEFFVIVLFIIFRIMFRNRRFKYRMIPTLGLLFANLIILPMAQPTTEVYPAVSYKNPVKTDVLSLENGDIVGVYNKDKTVRVYAGIPYAKAPIGDLRWKEPQDVENWEGVKDCTKFAAKSMQPAGNSVTDGLADIYAAKGWYPDFKMNPSQNMSEDSLYLNIWRPNNDKTNLPILVFIHGGSLTTGSSAYSDYNGEEMAKKDVIMITIQYRLGVFGYFAHQELIDESENNTTGNYGLLDQIKALEWINKNASYFGGDKNNITIAGESAGSSSVSAICVSPLAKGLFKRAIGESSSIVVKKAPHTYRELSDALEVGEKIKNEFKCKSIVDLHKISASKLVTTKYSNSSMTLDGYAINKKPYEVYEAHENNEEALLNGYNVKEADAFVIPTYLFSPTNKNNIKERLIKTFGDNVGNKIYELYKDKIEEDAFNTFNEIFSVYWFMQPHQSWSESALNAGVNVYRYQFTKENKYHGTYHAGEMIYAYGNVKNAKYKYRYNKSDEDLSSIMLTYWSNFAKNGNPNGDNLPNWSNYNLEDGKVMELGENVGLIDDRYKDLYPLINEFIEEQLNAPQE